MPGLWGWQSFPLPVAPDLFVWCSSGVHFVLSSRDLWHALRSSNVLQTKGRQPMLLPTALLSVIT